MLDLVKGVAKDFRQPTNFLLAAVLFHIQFLEQVPDPLLTLQLPTIAEHLPQPLHSLFLEDGPLPTDLTDLFCLVEAF